MTAPELAKALVGTKCRVKVGLHEYQGRQRNHIEYYMLNEDGSFPVTLGLLLCSQWVAWLDDNRCPASGRNAWIFEAVLAGKRASLPPEWTARLVRAALTRPPKPDEIERAVRTIYNRSVAVSGKRLGIKTKPDPAKVEAVVAASALRVEHLANMPCNKVRDFTFSQMSTRLWQPYALICCGLSRVDSSICRVQTLAKHRKPDVFEFVVPNGMHKPTGKTQDGKVSTRTLDNACPESDRRWLVVECDYAKFNKNGEPTIWKPSIEKWEAAGITVKDAAMRVVEHLLNRHAPRLTLVVDSGGKSLHCWLNVRDASLEEKQALMSDAVKLGADKATFTLNQWVRFPGGTRRNIDGSTTRQKIIFFNPDTCPQPQEKSL